MTRSTHTYTAFLIGSPDVELSVRGGRITLDSGSAPHVTGYVDVAVPDESILTDLDPRDGVRIRVEADAVFPSFSTSRMFDLGLRSRPMRHRDAVVTLDLASDEALLGDYAPLTDDATPRTHESSLRAVCNYVLGKIGASLAASPANDADVTAYWQLSNLITNPRAATTTGFDRDNAGGTVTLSTQAVSAMAGSSNTGTIQGLVSDTSATVIILRTRVSITAGRWYSARVGARKSNAGAAVTAVAQLVWRNAAGALVGVVSGSTSALSGTDSSYRTVSGLSPIGATQVDVAVRFDGTVAVGDSVNGRNWMLVEGPEAVPYFDGGSSLGGYTCTWQGDADAATSLRTPLAPLDARGPDSLVWRAGQSAIDFLMPLVQANGYRLVCDEAREWTLRSADYVAPGASTFVHGVDLTEASDTLDRESTWFDGQVTRYRWEDPNGISQERADSWALTGSPTRVNLVEINAPYPGTGRSEYAVRRAQGRGREVVASRVARWDERAEQDVSVLLSGAPTQVGLTDRVEFNLDNDEVTVTTRTSDANPGSIDLLPGTIDSLAGFINDL